jgi:hypothetical protein
MGWWSDIRDDVFSPELGSALGAALGNAWAQNYNQRGIDKAGDAIKRYQQDMLDKYADQHRAEAAEALKNQSNAGDYVGLTPQQGLLNAKRRWWQAQNDAQYLLNNGYGEDSDDVKKFRDIQNTAHTMADEFRKIGDRKHIDMSKVGGNVNSLAAAKAAAEAEMSPNYRFGNYQMPKNELDISYKKPPTKEEIAQAALGLKPFNYAPTKAEISELYRNGNASPQTLQEVANELAGAQPVRQNGTAQNQLPAGNNAANTNPYMFSVRDVQDAAKQAYSNPDTITMQDIYDVYGKGADYNTVLDATAKQLAMKDIASEKASPDYRDNLRRALINQGLPQNQVEAALAKMDKQEAEKTKKMLQGKFIESLASNPQAGSMLAMLVASGADPKDIINAFDKTKRNYTMHETDTGDKKYVSYYDPSGYGAGSTQTFNKAISPTDKMKGNLTARGQNFGYQTAVMKEQAANKRKAADIQARDKWHAEDLASGKYQRGAKSSAATAKEEGHKAKYDQYIQQYLNGDIDFNGFKEKAIGIPGHDEDDNAWEDNELHYLGNFLREYNRDPANPNTKIYWDDIKTGNDELLARIDPAIIQDMRNRYGD